MTVWPASHLGTGDVPGRAEGDPGHHHAAEGTDAVVIIQKTPQGLGGARSCVHQHEELRQGQDQGRDQGQARRPRPCPSAQSCPGTVTRIAAVRGGQVVMGAAHLISVNHGEVPVSAAVALLTRVISYQLRRYADPCRHTRHGVAIVCTMSLESRKAGRPCCLHAQRCCRFRAVTMQGDGRGPPTPRQRPPRGEAVAQLTFQRVRDVLVDHVAGRNLIAQCCVQRDLQHMPAYS